MNTLDLNSFVCVPLSAKLYAEFTTRYPGNVGSLMEDVLIDFLGRTEEDYLSETTGFQWASVFLPSGSQLRTKYMGEFKTAEIVEDKVIWNGDTYPSISTLANAMRNNTSNNAWKTIEVKLTNEKKWQLADRLR